MPDWVVAEYFSPEFERHRLVVHDYEQTELNKMRCMDNTKLVDSIEMPLKSCENVLTAVSKMLSCGLQLYLDQSGTPFIGDWPMQFYIRRLVYSKARMLFLLLVLRHFRKCKRKCIAYNYFIKYLLIYKSSYLEKRQS